MKFPTVLFLCIFCTKLYAQNDKTAPLTEVVEVLSKSIDEVNIQKYNVQITSVEATFTVSRTDSRGLSLNIWIFKIGRKKEKTDLRTVTLSLTKPEDKVSISSLVKSSADLTKFIESALSDFDKLNQQNLLSTLSEKEIKLEIGLVVKKETTVGGSYEINIFTLGAEGGKNNEQGHTLTLVFKPIPKS